MTKHTIQAKARKVVGRKVKQLRSGGEVPANIFGKDIKSTNIQVNEKDVNHFLKEAGESSLIYLTIEGDKEEKPVMIAEIKRDPVSEQILHVGFRQVNLKEKTTAEVPVKLVGEAPAEAEKMGILVQQLSEVEVEALPTDMPEELEVDISSLAAVDDSVLVKNIKVDAKITILTSGDEIVAKIEPLAAEEPVEAPAPAEGEEGEEKAGEEAKAEEGEEKAGEEAKAEEGEGEKEQSS